MLESFKRLFGRKQDTPPVPVGETVMVTAYCTRLVIPQPKFAHILHAHSDLADPDLLEHLNSFCDYVYGRGDGKMSVDKYHVILHLQRVQHHLSISVGIDDTAALYAWAREANALLFVEDGHVRDPDGLILVHSEDGKAEPHAKLPHPPQAWERKAATEALLAARGISVPTTLPPLICEEELALRGQDEILGRARSLLLVALRAESVASNEAMSVDDLLVKMPLADDHLSPKERAFLDKEAPSQQDCAQLIWRYESLYLLEWALGLVDELPFADGTCDSADAVAKLIAMRDPVLRPAGAILDALDLTYRLHWHVRQQRLKKLGEIKGVDADVVMERHHALNWLVRFQHAGWDEVDTPT